MNNHLQTTLSKLSTAIPDPHTIVDSSIQFTNGLLSITPHIGNITEDKNGAAAHIYYTVKSPLLDEDFFEMSSGLGTDVPHAISLSITSFCMGALCAWRHLINQEYQHTLLSSFSGKEITWDIAESCGIVFKERSNEQSKSPGKTTLWDRIRDRLPAYSGNQIPFEEPSTEHSFVSGEKNLWDIIKDRLPAYLGSRKLYWMKAYIAKQKDGSTVGEFRINNAVVQELSDLLNQYAASLECGNAFYTAKDIFFATQRQDTYIPYPHTKEQIEDSVTKALNLFSSHNGLEEEEYISMLSELISDRCLAEELAAWIPEICAENCWQRIRYSDFIQVHMGEDSEPVSIAKTQFTPYYWIENYVIQCFTNGRFSTELYRNLILRSAIAGAVLQVIEAEGEEALNGVSISSLSMNFDVTYQIR